MVRRKLRFFLRLGVFRPAKPEWAGQTCAPELVPTGCECLMGKGAVWEERVGPGPDGEGGRRGSPVWGAALLQSRVKAWSEMEPTLAPVSSIASSPTGLSRECMCGRQLDLHWGWTDDAFLG